MSALLRSVADASPASSPDASRPCLAVAGGEPVRVCFPFSGDSVGGSHVSVLGLLKQLDPACYRPIIVPEVPDGRIAQVFQGFEQLADPVWRPRQFVPGQAFGPAKFVRTLRGVWPRMRFLKEQRIAIVHLNDGRTSANWALAAKLAGTRIVWHHRGDPGALGLRLAAPLLADRVITVSSFSLPPRGIWSAAVKAEVIHSPFDTTISVDRASARAALVRELGIAPESIILGFFGAFVPRKRPLLFVDAVARLQQMIAAPVIGLMFGEARVAAMEEALRHRITACGLDKTIHLMGYRTPGPFWIAACDQLIVPAVGEPFGRTLIEAMLVGTPVVAAASGGNIEALRGDIGILVTPDDADALARGCAGLIADPEATQALAIRAGEDARHRFSEAHHHDQVIAVYERLLAR